MAGRAPPGAVTRARSGRLAGGCRSRGCPDAGQAGRCPVRLVRSAVGMSVQPVERTSSVQVSGVQASGAAGCPGVRCIQVSGRTRSGVRGAAAAPVRGLDTAWLGVVGRPGRARRVDVSVVCGRRGRLPASGRTGSDGAALAVAGSHEVDRSQGRRVAGVRLRRRLDPSGPTGALVQARVPAG
jgi:hypothetical protein